MGTVLITAPTTMPVTLDEVKTQLRVEGNDSDGELTALIKQATKYVEEQTGRKLITQTWRHDMDGFNTALKLPYPPLQSVSSITYQDESNVQQTLSSTNYTVDTTSEPARVYQSYNGTYPSTYDDLNSVSVTFVCGYGDRTDVPEVFKQAIKLYIQWIYDMDEAAEKVMDRIIESNKIPWFSYE